MKIDLLKILKPIIAFVIGGGICVWVLPAFFLQRNIPWLGIGLVVGLVASLIQLNLDRKKD